MTHGSLQTIGTLQLWGGSSKGRRDSGQGRGHRLGRASRIAPIEPTGDSGRKLSQTLVHMRGSEKNLLVEATPGHPDVPAGRGAAAVPLDHGVEPDAAELFEG